ITAATIAGFGRGANGAAGPFAPVEQAWIAREVAGVARRHALALNATVGFLGMAAGSALALVPGTFAHGVMTLGDYQLLFSIPVAASLFAIIVLAMTDETASAPPIATLTPSRDADALTRHENLQLRRLAIANAINGLAIGVIGPLMAYWFARRYGQGLTAIGPALAASFVLAALSSMLSGRIATRLGAVRAVLWMRAF